MMPSVVETIVKDLEDVLNDENLLSAFKFFLKRNFMSETLDFWTSICEIEAAPEKEKKGLFLALGQEFISNGCPRPVNISYDLIESLRHSVDEIKSGKPVPLPTSVLYGAKTEIYYLLASSCLSDFLASDIFLEFENGIVPTSKSEFSRAKAQDFFGMKIIGPLRRVELLKRTDTVRFVPSKILPSSRSARKPVAKKPLLHHSLSDPDDLRRLGKVTVE